MRFVYRLIVIIVVISLVFKFGDLLYKVIIDKIREKKVHLEKIQPESSRITYILDNHKELLFPIPLHVRSLTIITTANIASTTKIYPESEFNYSIIYKIISHKNKILYKNEYFHKTAISKYVNNKNEEFFPSYYTIPGIIPTESKFFNFDTSEFEKMKYISVKLSHSDSKIQDVGIQIFLDPNIKPAWENILDSRDAKALTHYVRNLAGVKYDAANIKKGKQIYEKYCIFCHDLLNSGRSAPSLFNNKVQDKKYVENLIKKEVIFKHMDNIYSDLEKTKSDILWNRMSNRKKERITLGNVYSPDLIIEQERRSVIQKLNVALGPLGVEGKDFKTRKLYVLLDIEGQKADFFELPSGLLIKAGHRGIVPVDEQGARFRFEFTKINNLDCNEENQPIKIKWYGKGVNKRSEYTVNWRQNSSTWFESSFEGGMIEIIPDNFISTKIYSQDTGAEVTPEPLNVQAYVTHSGQPVEFNISHIKQQPTPFKITLRYAEVKGKSEKFSSPEDDFFEQNYLLPPTIKDAPVISYEFLDKFNNVVQSGSLKIEKAISLYDKIVTNKTDVLLSEPTPYFFAIPAKINRVRLFSKYPVLIAAYTRPYKMEREIRVPEDYYISASLKDEKQPAWFAIKPAFYKELVLNHRSLLLTVQHRPPEDDEQIYAGQYLFEDYYPEGRWLSRYILTPIETTEAIRNRAGSPAYYAPLSPDKNVTMNFIKTTPLSSIQPAVLFFQKNNTPFIMRFFIDNILHYKASLAGTRGEIRLPPLTPGKHSIRVLSSKKVEFFINYVEPGDTVYLKRLVNIFDKKGLDFVFEKKDLSEESISIRLYSAYNSKEKNFIRVIVEKVSGSVSGPAQEWTFLNRRYIVRPDHSKRIPVLNTFNDYVDNGQLLFLPLGSDLKAGNYHINITSEKGISGYLAMYKLTPGMFEEIKYYQESYEDRFE